MVKKYFNKLKRFFIILTRLTEKFQTILLNIIDSLFKLDIPKISLKFCRYIKNQDIVVFEGNQDFINPFLMQSIIAGKITYFSKYFKF